jgi:hypothetical protein
LHGVQALLADRRPGLPPAGERRGRSGATGAVQIDDVIVAEA